MREGQKKRYTKAEWDEWRAQQANKWSPAPARTVDELAGPWPGRTGAWASDDVPDATAVGSGAASYIPTHHGPEARPYAAMEEDADEED